MSLQLIWKEPTPGQFRTLHFTEQIEVLRRVDIRQKSHLLRAVDNPQDLFVELPPQIVYLMMKELGQEHWSDLLGFASGEQWTAIFDLDCWSADRFNSRQCRDWLQALNEVVDPEKIRILKDINFELMLLILKNEVTVVTGPEEIENEDERIESTKQGGGYQLAFRDEDGAKLFGSLLEKLFRFDPDFFRYLIESMRAETFGLIEENVYLQRGSRLMDLGFPEPWRAKEVYARIDTASFSKSCPKKIRLGLTDHGLAPGFALSLGAHSGLLASLLSERVDENMAWELTALVNKLSLADKVDIGDSVAIKKTVQKSYNYLNLALEWLVDSGSTTGLQVLSNFYLEDLFRLGNSLLVQLHDRAAIIGQSAVGKYLDQPYQSCLEALLEDPPQFYCGLDEPLSEGQRMFSCAKDWKLACNALDQIDIQHRLFTHEFAMLIPQADDSGLRTCQNTWTGLTLSSLFLTALANRLMGRNFVADPLPVEELTKLHSLFAKGGKVRPNLRHETCQWLESLADGAKAFCDHCFDKLEDDFCSVRIEALDPRFLCGLILHNSDEL